MHDSTPQNPKLGIEKKLSNTCIKSNCNTRFAYSQNDVFADFVLKVQSNLTLSNDLSMRVKIQSHHTICLMKLVSLIVLDILHSCIAMT